MKTKFMILLMSLVVMAMSCKEGNKEAAADTSSAPEVPKIPKEQDKLLLKTMRLNQRF